VRWERFWEALAVVVACTGIFGFVIARIVLLPARGALTSQKQFIGNIAHELRTPLSVIKTNSEIALLSADVSQETR